MDFTETLFLSEKTAPADVISQRHVQSNRSDVLTRVAINRTDEVHTSESLVEKTGKTPSVPPYINTL
jgi:hypothetical protein